MPISRASSDLITVPELKGDFTLVYRVEDADLTSSAQYEAGIDSARLQYDQDVKRGKMTKASEDFNLKLIRDTYEKMEKNPTNHAKITISAKGASVLFLCDYSDRVNPRKSATLYNGKRCWSRFEQQGANIGNVTVDSFLILKNVDDVPLPAVNLPYLPLAKLDQNISSLTMGSPVTANVLSGVSLPYVEFEKGNIILDRCGKSYKIRSASAMNSGRVSSKWIYQDYKSFRNLWIGAKFRLDTSDHSISYRLISTSPEAVKSEYWNSDNLLQSRDIVDYRGRLFANVPERGDLDQQWNFVARQGRLLELASNEGKTGHGVVVGLMVLIICICVGVAIVISRFAARRKIG